MPIAVVDGVRLSFADYGAGEPVVLVTGSGARGQVWTAHQVPALTVAGYRSITVDNRGVPPSDVGPAGFTISDMAQDAAGLIGILGLAPCRIVGFSLGAMIVQELLLAHPGLITQAVLMATRGRSDVLRAAMSVAAAELADSGTVFPPEYTAVAKVIRYLSPRTQNDEQRVQDWLDVFRMSPPDTAISAAQRGLDLLGNRLEEYRKIDCPCLVIGFEDDLVAPPHLCREVAESIPDCRYEQIAGCGHYGYLEDPGAVNDCLIDFFRNAERRD